MAIDIRIQIDLTERQKRVMRAAVVAGTVIAALGIGVAIAAPLNTSWIANEQPVSASDLLSDMTELNRRTIATNGAVSYSVGATKYCGPSESSTTGAMGGYVGAKALCQAAPACGSSPTAHMCSAEEVFRSVQLGLTMPSGWYGTGTWAYDYAHNAVEEDCSGWTSNAATGQVGLDWQGTAGINGCSVSLNVLCCD